jgi:ABC-type bacteriocin/lantibiotic exporter with double-glycine peptidase domain
MIVYYVCMYLYATESNVGRNWPEAGGIRLDNVCVSYGNDGNRVLSDINLRINGGEKVR